MDLIDKLRERVEFEYQDAVVALDTLEKYLTRGSKVELPTEPKREPGRRRINRSRTTNINIRETVLRLAENRWVSVAELATEIGITRIQVRGVFNAKDLRDSIARRTTHTGVKEYLYTTQATTQPEPALSAQENSNGELEESLA